jgi:peptide/nickel transport system permease protein
MGSKRFKLLFNNWSVRLALLFLLMVVVFAIFAPYMHTVSPTELDPAMRLKGVSAEHWLGTDALGRDLYSRIVYGARISFMIGFGVLGISVFFGVIFGALAGYFDVMDTIIMRFMDGVMAIPNILLAIALVSVSGGSLYTVLMAISIPEIPRVTRIVRGAIMSTKSESFVEAAITQGTSVWTILGRHLLPSAIAPLIVHGAYVFASAVMFESVLSFLGAGIPPEIPSWGNIIAEGRRYFQMIPGLVLYTGVVLSLTILSINIIGDALRDVFDPKSLSR